MPYKSQYPPQNHSIYLTINLGTTSSPSSSSMMDWFSWLSRTTLDPSLIYDYGLTFARNELQLEDATYFNHEFLQSMGISIAKHRLEILKLVKKEGVSQRPNKKFSGVIKKCLRKCMNKLKNNNNEVKGTPVLVPPPEPNWYQGKCKGGALVKDPNPFKDEKPIPMYRSKTIALSGPLDGPRMHEKMIANKALKLSGPLDGRMNERMMYANRSPLMSWPVDGRFATTTKSPRVSGCLDPRLVVENRSPKITRPLDSAMESPMGHSPYNKPKAADFDYDDDHALWPTLFQDLKPT